MAKHRNILILLADGEHARFIRPGPHNVMQRDEALDSIAAHKRSADLGSDRPGAAVHSDSTAHHALAPRHDPHDLEKEKFAQFVARELNRAAAQNEFEELVLVAPAHTLTIIRDQLDGTAAARVVGTLAKDLVKTPDHELWPHLREHIPLAPPSARPSRAPT
jgi:protein required for attachment to host cells